MLSLSLSFLPLVGENFTMRFTIKTPLEWLTAKKRIVSLVRTLRNGFTRSWRGVPLFEGEGLLEVQEVVPFFGVVGQVRQPSRIILPASESSERMVVKANVEFQCIENFVSHEPRVFIHFLVVVFVVQVEGMGSLTLTFEMTWEGWNHGRTAEWLDWQTDRWVDGRKNGWTRRLRDASTYL